MISDFQTVPRARSFGYLSRVDPRARLAAAICFSAGVAAVHQTAAMTVALASASAAAMFSGIPLKTIFKRLAPLNTAMLLLAVLLPLSTPGKSAAAIGPLVFSEEGFILAAKIALKGNAIVLFLIGLLGTLEINTLGHALRHFRVPDKFTQILLFTVRYLDVLHREYGRLRAAMKVRGFRPRMDRHTYRTFGYLVGMLLVRGLDRAERIHAAMKCRGFQGRFPLLDHFAFRPLDGGFALISVLILFSIFAAEWL
jgi:cobalt/nickel transport system permease protein